MIPIFDAFQNSHSFLTSFEKLQIVLKFFFRIFTETDWKLWAIRLDSNT